MNPIKSNPSEKPDLATALKPANQGMREATYLITAQSRLANDALLQAFKAFGSSDIGAMVANAAQRLEQDRISERWRTDPMRLMPLFGMPRRVLSGALYKVGYFLVRLHEAMEGE